MRSQDKATLRRSLRAQRGEVAPDLGRAWSAAAAGQLLARRAPRAGETWALYAALPEEADPAAIAHAAEALGVRTLYPRVEAGELSFVAARLDTLQPGHFGVREPQVGERVPLGAADVVVVPGLGFDRAGGRLGYGRGYYDRALQGARAGAAPLCVGFAWALQLCDAVPTGSDDTPVDALVTEAGWLSFADRPV